MIGGGSWMGWWRVARFLENVTCPCAVRSCTDSRFSLTCGVWTAGIVNLLFFCVMVMRPVCVIGARCPVAVVVSVPVLRGIFAWGRAVCVGFAPESNMKFGLPSVVLSASVSVASSSFKRSCNSCKALLCWSASLSLACAACALAV